jgi:hypothetical protein
VDRKKTTTTTTTHRGGSWRQIRCDCVCSVTFLRCGAKLSNSPELASEGCKRRVYNKQTTGPAGLSIDILFKNTSLCFSTHLLPLSPSPPPTQLDIVLKTMHRGKRDCHLCECLHCDKETETTLEITERCKLAGHVVLCFAVFIFCLHA